MSGLARQGKKCTKGTRKRSRAEPAIPSLPAEPVAGERALLFSPRGGPATLVVGDLHIGIETEYAHGGVKIPSGTPRIVERLAALARSTRARRLVIAGDLKHSIQAVTDQERVELPRALCEIAQAFEEVVIVPGNHDGLADTLLPADARNLMLAPVGGFLCRGGLLVVHGHAWPDRALAGRARGLVVAHNHTAIALQDPLGRVSKEPAWARASVNPEAWRERVGARSYPEVILIPPFNELCTGVALNVPGARPIGPLLREGCVDLPRANVYLLDGIWLGRVRDLDLVLSGSAAARLTRGISEDL